MKKLILVIASALVTFVASAQIRFGVKGGVNIANISYSGTESQPPFQSITGYNGGAFIVLPLTSKFSLQPEVVYSTQGTSFNSQNMEVKVNYNYLNIPILFKYHHASGLFAETGPQFGYLISAKDISGDLSGDIKSSTQSSDFSWVFGLGYKIPIINIGVDARYNLGLTNIDKDASAGAGTLKNSVFQFGLFYIFPR